VAEEPATVDIAHDADGEVTVVVSIDSSPPAGSCNTSIYDISIHNEIHSVHVYVALHVLTVALQYCHILFLCVLKTDATDYCRVDPSC